MTRLRFPDPQDARRARSLEAFEEAEASLRFEGMRSVPIFYELKARILSDDIGFDEAVAILAGNYPSNPPDANDWEDLRQYDPPGYYAFMESLDVKLRELAGSDQGAYDKRLGELETAENFVTLIRLRQQREATRRLAALGGSSSDMRHIPRRRLPR